MKTTSLSIGSAIRDALVRHGVDKRVSKIFPLVVDDAKLPYILYRRAGFEQQAVKTHAKTPDVVEMEVACFAATYSESVEIAELVREALDYGSTQAYRSCFLVDASEHFVDDAFVQNLRFEVRGAASPPTASPSPSEGGESR